MRCIAKALKKMDNPKGLSAVESRLAKEVVSESKKLANSRKLDKRRCLFWRCRYA